MAASRTRSSWRRPKAAACVRPYSWHTIRSGYIMFVASPAWKMRRERYSRFALSTNAATSASTVTGPAFDSGASSHAASSSAYRPCASGVPQASQE
jgi:hypothetical protein